jgi:hypothetical protein
MPEVIARTCDRDLAGDGPNHVKCGNGHRFLVTADQLTEVTADPAGKEVEGKQFPRSSRCPHQYGGMVFNVSFG